MHNSDDKMNMFYNVSFVLDVLMSYFAHKPDSGGRESSKSMMKKKIREQHKAQCGSVVTVLMFKTLTCNR